MRGKKRFIEDIEKYVFYDYDMKKIDDCEHELGISYENEKDLEEQIDRIVRDADLEGFEKNWY